MPRKRQCTDISKGTVSWCNDKQRHTHPKDIITPVQRSQSATGAYNTNEWNDVIISIADGVTDVYVNGTRTSSVDSTVNISDMLGKNSVAYIGKANWGTGEFTTRLYGMFL